MPPDRQWTAAAFVLCAVAMWLSPRPAAGQAAGAASFESALTAGEAGFESERAPAAGNEGGFTPAQGLPASGNGGPGMIERLFFQIEERPELDIDVQRGPELDMPFRPLTPPPPEDEPKKWFDRMRITGYAQFRYNEVTHRAGGSALPHHAGDASVAPNESILIRRARLIFAANVSDHVFVYLQPDFATTPPDSPDANHFVQIRDWYADVYFDKEKVYRLRAGQSKVPYGWENMQSSSRRAPLDRNDAFNSATRNERDLGMFFYWTPEYVQEVLGFLSDEGLKPSGDYGAFGIGIYNGQGGAFRDQNDEVHFVSRFAWPFRFADGQVLEVAVQGYTGRYVVLGSPIRPLGAGDTLVPLGTRDLGGRPGHLDQRLGWTAVYYPQPLGLQAEWTMGRGPALDATQTALERRSLHGGYVMGIYKYDSWHGIWFPFARWQYFRGGYKSARNAPYTEIDELELGVDWEIRPEMRLTVAYTFTDRTNLTAMERAGQRSYEQFDGQLLRTQFQVNY